MRGLLAVIIFTIFIAACVNNNQNPIINNDLQKSGSSINDNLNDSSEVMDMKIISPEFKNNEFIPKKFSCQGEDMNPEINIEEIPKNAKSLALIVDDPDAPVGLWVHWVLWNIPINGTNITIAENSVPTRAVQGVNSWLNNTFGGPCPPSGTHRYFFKAYAIDITLNIPDTTNKTGLEKAMQGHIIAQAELIGLYKKN